MSNALQLIAPSRDTHRDELFDLIAKVFSHAGYYNFLDSLRVGYLDGSHYDWSASRIGLLDGRIVTHFGVWDYQMRIGAARVRCGGIGVVATHGDYRKRGLMELTATACVGAMREAGYDMSMLFGIVDFYHRFGYTRAFSETEYTINTADLPAEKPAQKIAQFDWAPRADLEKLFNRQFATVTGTAVRPTYNEQNPRRKDRQGYLWPAKGQPAGYVLVADKGQHIEVAEAVGDTEQILRAVGQIARKAGADKVKFAALPYDTDLARHLRRGNCSVETRHSKCGNAMIRTLDLRSTLAKMESELSRRLKSSPLAGWRGQLRIADKNDAVTLSIAAGKVAVDSLARSAHAIQGGDEIAQLLIGTDDPQEIAATYNTRLTGDAKILLPFLFPNEHPMLHLVDRY